MIILDGGEGKTADDDPLEYCGQEFAVIEWLDKGARLLLNGGLRRARWKRAHDPGDPAAVGFNQSWTFGFLMVVEV
jgi:hypothetical protein